MLLAAVYLQAHQGNYLISAFQMMRQRYSQYFPLKVLWIYAWNCSRLAVGHGSNAFKSRSIPSPFSKGILTKTISLADWLIIVGPVSKQSLS